MSRKTAIGVVLTLLLASMLSVPLNVRRVNTESPKDCRRAAARAHIFCSTLQALAPPVHNLNTGLDYYTIQEAIDAAETLNGHEIVVDAGIYYEHVVVSKSVSLVGENLITTIVDNPGAPVIEVTVDDVTIRGFTISSGSEGINLDLSDNNTIFGNNIANGGINLLESSKNSISGNNITDGVNLLSSSSNNSISGNEVTGWIGLAYSSDNNTIHQNNVTNGGVSLGFSSHNIISENRITGNGYSEGFKIGYGSHNTISGNNITGCGDGINLMGTSNNTISGNTIANNQNGLVLHWVYGGGGDPIYSLHNIIVENNVMSSDEYGIQFDNCSDNSIYHNNFISNADQVHTENSINAWDDDYPSGGNYWSDYLELYPTVVDENHGENQDLPGSDIIWDSSYEIEVGNRDRYPLSEPWNPPKIPGDVNRDNIVNVLDLTIVSLSYGWHCEEIGYNRQADLNLDGWVDMMDLVIVARNLLRTYP